MNSRAQAGLEYLMTYGWGLILIATTVGVLVFVIGSPAEQFRCTVSDPQKFILKAYTIPSSGYFFDPNRYDQWQTYANGRSHNAFILQNITGGKITINRIEAFNGTGHELDCVGVPGYSTAEQEAACYDPGWCPTYTRIDEEWIDMSCAKTAYIHNYYNQMTINGICQSHYGVDECTVTPDSMCRDGKTIEVIAGGLITLEDFGISTQTCIAGYNAGWDAPGKIRLLYTDQFGLNDEIIITCQGVPKIP